MNCFSNINIRIYGDCTEELNKTSVGLTNMIEKWLRIAVRDTIEQV